MPDSQVSGPDTHYSNSLVQTEKSISSFEATWQAAQIISHSASTASEPLSAQLKEGLGATQEPISQPSLIRNQLSPNPTSPISQGMSL